MDETEHQSAGEHQDAEGMFAYQMRRRRGLLGLSQNELAERLASLGYRMYQQTIGKIESGNRAVRLSEAIAIAAALETTIEEMTSANQRSETGPGNLVGIDTIKAEAEAAEASMITVSAELAEVSELLDQAERVRREAQEKMMALQLRHATLAQRRERAMVEFSHLRELVDHHQEGLMYRHARRRAGYVTLKPQEETDDSE